MSRVPVLVSIVLSLLGHTSSPAQVGDAPPTVATPWLTVRMGLASYGTGDEVNCASLPASTAGVRVSTPTSLFVAVGADIYDGLGGFGCTAVLPIVDYGGGVHGEEFAGVWLARAPRVTASAGYRRMLRSWDAEISMAVGVLRSSSDNGPSRRQRTEWRHFQGGTLLLGPAGGWWAVSAERGRHRVPVRHEMYRREEHSEVPLGTRYFERWASLTRIGVELRW